MPDFSTRVELLLDIRSVLRPVRRGAAKRCPPSNGPHLDVSGLHGRAAFLSHPLHHHHPIHVPGVFVEVLGAGAAWDAFPLSRGRCVRPSG